MKLILIFLILLTSQSLAGSNQVDNKNLKWEIDEEKNNKDGFKWEIEKNTLLELPEISNKKIFCKGGAEGVFLFINLKKGIFGVLKVIDGNERVLPSAVCALFEKLKIFGKEDLRKLKDWSDLELQNHAKIKMGL